jgi:hypothetical protein
MQSEQSDFLKNTTLIDNAIMIKAILSQAAKKQAPILFTSKDQSIVYRNHKLLQTALGQITLKSNLQQEIIPKEWIQIDAFCIIIKPEAIFFFKPQVVESNERGIVLNSPLKLFKIQRRANERYIFPSVQLFKVSFLHPDHNHTRLELKVADLSTGGLSFLVENQFIEHFPIKQTLDDMRLLISNQTFKDVTILTQSVVRHITPFEHNMFKIGVQFLGLSKEASRILYGYLTELQEKQLLSKIEF